MHVQFLEEVLNDAEVAEITTAFFLVAGEPRPDEAEVIYIPPPHVSRFNYPLVERIGSQLLHEYDGLHRFAAYRERDEVPLGSIATELRHEVQHAVQFNLYGPDFFELNQLLRDLARTTGATPYEAIPSERDANRAAAQYAAKKYPAELEAMASNELFSQYTVEVPAHGDLLTETIEVIWQLADQDETDEHTRRPLVDVVDELRQGAVEWNKQVEAGADRSVSRQERHRAVIELPVE